jgi:hypothetical protein
MGRAGAADGGARPARPTRPVHVRAEAAPLFKLEGLFAPTLSILRTSDTCFSVTEIRPVPWPDPGASTRKTRHLQPHASNAADAERGLFCLFKTL